MSIDKIKFVIDNNEVHTHKFGAKIALFLHFEVTGELYKRVRSMFHVCGNRTGVGLA